MLKTCGIQLRYLMCTVHFNNYRDSNTAWIVDCSDSERLVPGPVRHCHITPRAAHPTSVVPAGSCAGV